MVGNKGAIRNARLMLITLIGRDTNPLGNILELKRDYDYNLSFGFFMKWISWSCSHKYHEQQYCLFDESRFGRNDLEMMKWSKCKVEYFNARRYC